MVVYHGDTFVTHNAGRGYQSHKTSLGTHAGSVRSVARRHARDCGSLGDRHGCRAKADGQIDSHGCEVTGAPQGEVRDAEHLPAH